MREKVSGSVWRRTKRYLESNRTIRSVLVGLGVTTVAATACFLYLPQPARLGVAETGDAGLGARVREAVGNEEGFRGLSVAFIDGERTTFAGLGNSGNPEHPSVGKDTVFEVGSIGKPMTGMLLASLADQKRIDLSTPLERLLPRDRFSDPALASATLTDLLTHRSGLALMPTGLDTSLREAELRLLGRDPYRGFTEQDLFTAAADASLGPPGTYVYSNFGMALAGQTAARLTGKPYDKLLKEELLDPLGMDHSQIVRSGEAIPPNSASGTKATGPAMDHWRASGFTPAGDLWSTSNDLAIFLRAVLAKTAPGARATDPLHPRGPNGAVGLGWNVSRTQGRSLVWHDGATGGFTSYVGMDPARGRGVVVLSNTDRSVDAVGRRLLGFHAASAVQEPPESRRFAPALTVVFSLCAGLLALWTSRHRGPGPASWIRMAIDVLFGAGLLALVWRLGSWLVVPPEVWGLGVFILAGGIWSARNQAAPRAGSDKAAGRPGGRWPLVRFTAVRVALLILAAASLV
ncbi:serine hydrolase domain-containing protein [Streptomyces sp. NPDC003032]